MGSDTTFLKKLSFLYIYLNKEILYLIKSRKLNKNSTAEDTASRGTSSQYPLLKLLLRAIVTNFLVFCTMVYIHQGSLDSRFFWNSVALFELTLTTVFLFLVFLVHRAISNLVNSTKLAGFNSLAKKIAEALMVVITSLTLLFLILYVPFKFVYPDVEIPPDRVRFNNVVVTIITLFFYYFVERERGKKQLQKQLLHSARLQKENFEAQLQGLKNQVNPHFLFNSLNVLSSLISIDAERAKKFTSRLSQVYRSFLDNSNDPLVPLRKEMEVVTAYAYLLETRFGEAVKVELDIEPEKMQLQIPPGSLQMLLENAVKHNGSTRKKPIKISIFTEDDHVVVQNNLQPRMEEMESTRTGLKNIKSRYSFLSDREVKIEKTATDFVVKLPLLKVEAYANPDH